MPIPPESVARVAADALNRRRYRAKTTLTPGGTATGVARARDLKNRRNFSEQTLVRMRAWFARHDTPAERRNRGKSPFTRASIAWDLWGGDAGRAWVERELEKLGR